MNSALVIGYGSVGALHARVLEELGCDVAVVSAREEVHHRCFPDLSSALLRTAPDYVVVANETALHARTVRGVRDAGFLGVILVEKPVRDTSGEQIDAWAQPLYVGYNLRFHPALARLRREVEGVQIHAAEIRCGSYLPAWRSNRDYRRGASASRAAGGGVLRDLSHELDYGVWLLGGWRRLAALGGRVSDLEIETEDVMVMLLETERCPAVTICVNYLDRPSRRGVHLTTSTGSFTLDLVAGLLTDGAGQILESTLALRREHTYAEQHRALLSGRPGPCCTLQEGEEVVGMIAATERAARTGMWITNHTS